jgi:peroxiredoxin
MFRRILLMMVLMTGGWTTAAAPGLQDLDGKPRQLENYTGKGKWLVVMIWASDCLICNKEAHQYEKFHQQHRNKDATVLGISVDGPANIKDARKFVADHKLTFPNLIGELEVVGVMVQDLTGQEWVGTPTILVYDPTGMLKVADAGAVPVQLIEQFINTNRN